MRTTSIVLGCSLFLGAAVLPLHAQKPRRASPTLVTPNAPAAPAPASPAATPPSDSSVTKGRRASPTLVNRPGVTVDSTRTTARTDAAQRGVAMQAARPATAAPAFTAGLSMTGYTGESDDDRNRYLRTFSTQLDSATALLVGVFRATSGQPLAGAEAPTSLSARERERWGRCRDLHFDLQSYGPALQEIMEQLPEAAPVQRAAGSLDSSLAALRATEECDNITSMITAPGRWTPWAAQYASSARNFYQGWYSQVRDVADRNRAFVVALNAAVPAASRMPVPPALPRNPPYAGAGPR